MREKEDKRQESKYKKEKGVKKRYSRKVKTFSMLRTWEPVFINLFKNYEYAAK